MKAKMRMALILATVLLLICISTAVAELAPIDPFHEASDYFKQTYVLEGDLGDESIPPAIWCGFAVLTTIGAIVIHKRRKSVH